ncbi:hypothetical protein HP550_10655 [Cellulomonas humilata]|uniref:Uncharacterized protein n=1 Tax=Cellulomonas humilata TaxID=144055 RepID=A0A7Y6DY57_9CELL|nr:hypothetical protein [Cellulomonas humilata]NUU17707.1 hypothetical protein [Cellulomonas humilata]
MTQHEDHGWFDDDWADDPDDQWADVPWVLDVGGPDDDLPDPAGAVLRAGADALAVLLDLVGPERAGPPALWFVLLDHSDRTIPVVLPITDVPVRADAAVARRLVAVLDSVLASDAPGGSVVVGLVRAAGGDRGAFEASWVPALREAADDAGVRLWAVVAIGQSRARVLEW